VEEIGDIIIEERQATHKPCGGRIHAHLTEDLF
jgi:hypothetical protein